MKFKKIAYAIAITASMQGLQLHAADLIQAYQDALHNDTTYKQARAQWMADKELSPIARATLLPQIDIKSSWMHANTHTNNIPPTGGTSRVHNNQTTYGLTLTQPLFNFAGWAGLASANNTVHASAATFNAASQDLISRTAAAYFDVLSAASNLESTMAAKRSYLSQLNTSREKYKVGLVAITPLYEAEAQYDTAAASEIADRNILSAKIEALRQITGHIYPSLMSISGQVPLLRPNPDNINLWVNKATQQNFSLIAQHYLTMAAMNNIKAQAAARLPNISLTGSLNHTDNSNNAAGFGAQSSNALGFSLDFPIFQGGAVFANTKQARAQYVGQSALYEQLYRQTISDTRTAFLGVASSTNKIIADRQSVKSNRNAVKTTKASYTVGTRTMVDVLNAYQKLYAAQATYTTDQYSYLTTSLQLKQDAGTLSIEDLRAINNWLKNKVAFTPLKSGDYKLSYSKAGQNIKSTPKTKGVSKPRTTKKAKLNNTKHSKQSRDHQYIMRHPRPLAKHRSTSVKALKPNNAYAIQVFAARNKAAARNFIAQHKDAANLRISSHRVRGNIWYQVLYGSYSSRQAATASLATLQQYHAYSPWVVKG